VVVAVVVVVVVVVVIVWRLVVLVTRVVAEVDRGEEAVLPQAATVRARTVTATTAMTPANRCCCVCVDVVACCMAFQSVG